VNFGCFVSYFTAPPIAGVNYIQANGINPTTFCFEKANLRAK
jgi:hypothetical protein